MTERLEDLAATVSTFLGQMGVECDRSDAGLWLLRYGSTVVMISLFEDHGHAFVRIGAPLLAEVEPRLELVTRLLRLNTEVVVGAFLLFEDHTLTFAHTILADELDFGVFEHGLRYVARVADDHDEELQSVAGGKRMEDLLASGR
jgi:hypothetical protein